MAGNPLLDAFRELVNAKSEEERHRILNVLQLDLLKKNMELYNSVKSLDINHKKYQNELEWFKLRLNGFFEFIKEEVLTRSGNATDRREVIEMLCAILKVYEDSLKMLVHAIYEDDKEASSRGTTWSTVLYRLLTGAGPLIASLCSGNTKAIVLSGAYCGACCVAAGVVYYSGSNIGGKIDQLEDDVEKFRREVGKYHTDLERRLMSDVLSRSCDTEGSYPSSSRLAS